ncbi:MAG: GTP cyclohydrolase I FolE, partial [Candidatus Peregrinibacteria bacterium]
GVGEDIEREGLRGTPKRAAEAMKFLTQGYRQDLDKIINGAVYDADCKDMVICRDIELYSLCEHHLLPFIGKCHIGYIPNKKLIGLSKMARIVDYFARRLQIQERLTTQIAETLEKYVQPLGVAVVIEAQHLCMMMRGVEKQNSVMQTSAMLGLFRKRAATRNEFLNLIRRG